MHLYYINDRLPIVMGFLFYISNNNSVDYIPTNE